MAQETKFWADQVAQDLAGLKRPLTVATGITPSGDIHIGNLREIVTADVVVRALKAHGKKPRFIYIADTYDPLRRVYPFLDPALFTPHVGKPLSEIPSPDGASSYAEHFLKPFVASLKRLEVPAEVIRADELYKEGRYVQNIIRSLEGVNRIRSILKEETGRDMPEDWSPFNPVCNVCRRMTETKVLGFNAEKEEVSYRCRCGDEGVAPMRGGGKLSWRVDWPARWELLGVTVEPFGKDHASRGGSYDTGVRIAREIFDYEPPHPVIYEWISLQGVGDMSSSKGNVISIADMLEVAPPEVLKYAITKVKPNHRIVFDPALPLLQLVDEFDDPRSRTHHVRAAELSAVSGSPSLGVPFRHLVSLLQTTGGDERQMKEILDRTGYPIQSGEAFTDRVQYAKHWLKRFAPPDVRFEVKKDVPASVSELTEMQRRILGLLADKLERAFERRGKKAFRGEDVHALVYEIKSEEAISPKDLFAAIYEAILGQKKGPRAGFFLASLPLEFVLKRFREVAASTP